MKLEEIKDEFNKGRMKIEHIECMIQTIEMLQESQKNLIAEIRNLKAKTRFKVYQENLVLIKERDEYKAAFESLRLATPDRRIRKDV